MTNSHLVPGPMTEAVARKALAPLGPVFHQAVSLAWPKYVESRLRIDAFPVGPAAAALLLRDAILHEFHPLAEPLVRDGTLVATRCLGFDLWVAQETHGYDGCLGLKINSTGDDFRPHANTPGAESRLNQEPWQLALFAEVEVNEQRHVQSVSTWVTAAYSPDPMLRIPPALAFSCYHGQTLLWSIPVEGSDPSSLSLPAPIPSVGPRVRSTRRLADAGGQNA
ncbi:MAG: hypothetical protein HMLKMBBP_03707 [Planctomycetes bacterium]|nr:hypothetical protein [Planctomycetota bacterium]